MARPLRIEFKGCLYHITSRGNEGGALFHDDGDRKKFLEILADYHDRYGILLHGFVLMGNHYHLILETPQGNLLKVMHGINSSYTGYFNRKYDRKGHLFQGRYKAILVDRDAYLIPLSRYVHLNPVRAGLVKKPEDYPWSSYRGYIRRGAELGWVEYAWVFSQFGTRKDRASRKYRDYVEEGLTGAQENPLEKLYGQILLGGGKFVSEVKEMVKGKPLSPDIVEKDRFRDHPSLDEILKEVIRSFRTTEENVRRRGSKNNTARLVAIYLVQRYSDLSNEEIGSYFGGVAFSAVSKASARLRRALEQDPKMRCQVAAIESNVKA